MNTLIVSIVIPLHEQYTIRGKFLREKRIYMFIKKKNHYNNNVNVYKIRYRKAYYILYIRTCTWVRD